MRNAVFISFCWLCVSQHLTLFQILSDKGAKATPAEAAAPSAAAPVKRLDNLFFIEEPQNVSVTESKHEEPRLFLLSFIISRGFHFELTLCISDFGRGYCNLYRQDWR